MVVGALSHAPAGHTVRFEFSAEFEQRVLAAMTVVAHFIPSFAADLDPRLFVVKAHECWAKAALDLGKRYGRPPSLVAVREAAGALVGSLGYEDLFPADLDALKAAVERAASEDLSYVVERVKDFCKRQALLGLALRCREQLDADPAAYERNLMRALRIGEAVGGQTVGYAEDVAARIVARRNPQHDRYMPTGIPRLDEMLLGGVRYGEFCIVLAPAGGGKTTLLLNVAAGAASLGGRVLYISHEVKPPQLQDRLDTCLCAIPTPQLVQHEAEVVRTALAVHAKGGEVKFHFWPRGTATIGHYRGLLARLADAGWTPDVLISDYAERMADPPGVREFRHAVSYKYSSLFSLAQESGMVVWSAAQTNRSGYGKAHVDLGEIGEDFSIAGTVDVILAVSETSDMEQKGVIRMSKVKDRNRTDGQSIEMGFHKVLQRFE